MAHARLLATPGEPWLFQWGCGHWGEIRYYPHQSEAKVALEIYARSQQPCPDCTRASLAARPTVHALEA